MKTAAAAATVAAHAYPPPDATAAAVLPTASAVPAELNWLDGTAPEALTGATWGVPWPRGAVKAGTPFALRTATGGNGDVPVQTWALALWPDGSLKWTGHAVGPDAGSHEKLVLMPGVKSKAEPGPAVTVRETAQGIEIDTGVLKCRVAKSGSILLTSLERDGKTIATNGRLVCLRQDAPEMAEEGGVTVGLKRFVGTIKSATLEQRGPVRAVVRLEGEHQSADKKRAWLPFTVRLYFYAGGDAVRMVHSFVFDGDENRDFVRGLGVRFDVPLRDALHDRHVRFAGEGDGLWAEAVRGLTGLRRDPGADARNAQIAGRAVPDPDQLPDAVRTRLELVPAWGDYTLTQPTPDGFLIRKRTKAGHGWIKAGAGHRASGLGYVGGATGGVAFGLRDFWQRYPTQLDVRGAAGEAAEVTVWLWSPDAPPMDLRFYHDGMGMETHAQEREGLEITYEDYEKGWGTPHGVARTSELTLWALDATPTRERFVALAGALRNPPRLACSPAHLHAAGVFANWSLPDRSTPAKRQIEDQLNAIVSLFQKQVEQRRWYGFWDFGDFMHSYDRDRHEWCYDVGGFAWANSELSPDLWLWYSYLRTGRADIFRLAEAMTRHTSEVDVHHIGRFAGFGSRHNVQHWGDSSKQPRVSTAAYRRMFYYLTADERTGDLMRELLDADRQLSKIVIGRKLDVAARDSEAPPDPHSPNTAHAGFGTDWCSFASAWLTEWERTGDKKWRDKIVAGMRTIGALPRGWLAGGAPYDPETGRFSGPGDTIGVSHLNAVFGAQEVNAELLSLLDVPEYERAWLLYCEFYNASPEEKERLTGVPSRRAFNLGESHSRLTAYAAQRKKDPALAARAWREFYGAAAGVGVRDDLSTRCIEGPAVLNPVDEGIVMSTNAASQWGLAAIENLALIGEFLPSDPPPARPVPAKKDGDA